MPRKTRNKRKRACTRKNNYSRGRGRRWNKVKMSLRKAFQPDWYRSRKVRQRHIDPAERVAAAARVNAAAAAAARDALVASQIAAARAREDKQLAAVDLRDRKYRVGNRFSELLPPPPPQALYRSVSPRPLMLDRIGKHLRDNVGPYVMGAVEDQIMSEMSGLPFDTYRAERQVERDGIAQHVFDTAVNKLVSHMTGLPPHVE